jgi:signal peptidase I
MKAKYYYLTLMAAAVAVSLLFITIPISLPVLSSSMLPTLLGSHWKLTCPKCASSFFLTVDYPYENKIDGARFTSCPECGFSEIPIKPIFFAEGDRLSIRRFPHPSPCRWDLVAFRIPEGKRVGVKRVVGLPGELLELKRGVLLINGEPIAKEPVGRLTVPIALHPEIGVDRLFLIHTVPQPHLTGETGPTKRVPTPITNLSPIPSLEGAGRPDFVDDYVLTFPTELLDSASLLINQGDRLWLVLRSGSSLEVELRNISMPESDPERFRGVTQDDFASAPCYSFPLPSGEGDLTLSTCDAFVILSIEGKELCRIPNPPLAEQNLPVTCPVSLLTDSPGELSAKDLTVRRDIGYGSLPARRLADDEYFLLGDNPPVSIDSRVWKTPLRRRSLMTIRK